MAAAATMLKQTRMTILLSVNAAAIVVAGIIIASAIGLNTGGKVAVVAERSDTNNENIDEAELVAPTSDTSGNYNGYVGSTNGEEVATQYSASSVSAVKGTSSGNVGANELWSADSVTIYETADIDICIDDTLPGFDNMYWQTSNENVISSFYAGARTYLGYSSARCRYPKIVGTGTTVITAGTYDGERRDSITVNVIPAPVEQWKREVLNLVNAERTKIGLNALEWGSTCEDAANLRAAEIKVSYAHTRPDGSSWATACPIPASGGASGENLAAGSSTVSPATVVAAWMNSEEHRKNILNPDYSRVAIGFEFDLGTQYKTYWSQFFSSY